MNRYILTALLVSLIFTGCDFVPSASDLAELAEFSNQVVVDFSGNDSVAGQSVKVMSMGDPEDWYEYHVATEGIRMVKPMLIIGTALTFLAPIAVVWIVCYFIYRTKRDRSRVVYESIVTGRPIPPGYFPVDRPQGATLRSAITYIAWGVGGGLFFFFVGAEEVSCLFVVPIIIGMGRLLAFFLYDYKRKSSDAD